MEKQGMDRRKRLFRFGLLIFFSLLLVFGQAWLWADEGENIDSEKNLDIQIETHPENPIVNSSWSVILLINHPVPEEVSVAPPRFPPSLVLDRVRTDSRQMAEDEKWTRVEFQFTPMRVDTIALEPFEVKARDYYAQSPKITVRFRGETVRRYEPRFRWAAQSPSVHLWEKQELILELTNWDPSKRPPRRFFQGRAPFNAVLEEASPVRAGDVIRYRITVIPLEESSVGLEPFSFSFENYLLNVPGINVSVLPSRQPVAAPPETEIIPPDFIPELPFPQNREKVFFLFRGEYDRIVSRAETLWDGSLRAEALVEIRKNERDSLAGPSLATLRLEMEQALGLELTENENWRLFRIQPLIYMILIILIAIFSVGVVLFVFRSRLSSKTGQGLKCIFSYPVINWRNITLRRRSGFISIVVFVLLIGMVTIVLEESMGSFPFGRSGTPGKTAVLKKTQGYRIPDFNGAVNDNFDEGQPVIVGDYKGDWCFAETPDGRYGWVKRESVITY
jgi:hypothetical protein